MTQLSVADVLERAADLIEPEGAWIQGDFAHNAKGENTGLSGYRGPAVCWCMLGATSKASGRDSLLDFRADKFLTSLIGDVSDWNDAPGRTQPEVVAKLREAAALARQQESTSC